MYVKPSTSKYQLRGVSENNANNLTPSGRGRRTCPRKRKKSSAFCLLTKEKELNNGKNGGCVPL
jgi:hypothetical protein